MAAPHDLWRHRGGRRGLMAAAMLAMVTVIGPWLAGDPDVTNYQSQLAPPSWQHWLGTDQAGRDVLARTLAGATTSLSAAVTVFALTSALGLVIGVVAGTSGGVVDAVLNRCIDVLLSLPSQVLALAVVGLLGPGFVNLVLAMTLTGWAGLAKLARTFTLGADRRPYVIAARMAGVPRWKVLLTHVVPGAWGQVVVAATLRMGGIVLALGGLSFLGLGAQPPTAEWGNMLAEARTSLSVAPWQLIGPTVGLFWSVASVTLVADALRDVTAVRWQ